MKRLLPGLLSMLLLTRSPVGAAAPADESPRARNVILLIGDGMSHSALTIARNYAVGAGGRLAMDEFRQSGNVTTYAVLESKPTQPDYVPDSAATASAWSTGVKTSNGRISTTAGTDRDAVTLLELAQRAGLRVGNVSTAEITDATPAAAAAHVSARACQGPRDMARCPQDRKSAGGPGSIAEQLVDRRLDVILGGGRDRFAQTIEAGPEAGKSVLQSAVARGHVLIGDSAELLRVGAQRPVLGLFTAGNMSLEWRGEPARAYPGSGPQRCVENQRPAAEPSLEQMTRKAIELLDTRAGRSKRKGFFLQVEGASIDKQAHAANPCAQIGETLALDRAVRVALDYARKDGETLVIVTGDHDHTPQIVPAPTPKDHSPGVFSTLITNEGAEMTISYASSLPGRSQEHTGTQVRIAAYGPGAERFLGVIDQTEIFTAMLSALRLQR